MFFPTYYPKAKLEWKNKENQDSCFKVLFTLFWNYCLPHLFPSFTMLAKSTNLYLVSTDWAGYRGCPQGSCHSLSKWPLFIFKQNSHFILIFNGNFIVRGLKFPNKWFYLFVQTIYLYLRKTMAPKIIQHVSWFFLV